MSRDYPIDNPSTVVHLQNEFESYQVVHCDNERYRALYLGGKEHGYIHVQLISSGGHRDSGGKWSAVQDSSRAFQ